MAQIPVSKCGFCNSAIATLYCEECHQILCIQCRITVHDKVPIFKGHKVGNIHKEGNSVFKIHPVCEIHRSQFLYFCSKCECLTCAECMTSNHNEHKTEKIKKVADARRKNVNQMIEHLKTRVETVKTKLETIDKKHTDQIRSDCESYRSMVEKTTGELQEIIDRYKLIHMTTAFDFKDVENQDLDRKRVFLKRRHEATVDRILKFENLLHETHDSTFLSELKAIQTDAEIMQEEETEDTLCSPNRIDSFDQNNFTRSVMKEIEEKFKVRHQTTAELSQDTTAIYNKQSLREKDTVNLVLIGTKGSGKSSTGNTIVKQKIFKSSHGTIRITKEVKSFRAPLQNVNLFVVDTPGLMFGEETYFDRIRRDIDKLTKERVVYAIVIRIGRVLREEVTMTEFLLKRIKELQKNTIMLFTNANELLEYDDYIGANNVTAEYWLAKVPSLKEMIDAYSIPNLLFENINASKEDKDANVNSLLKMLQLPSDS